LRKRIRDEKGVNMAINIFSRDKTIAKEMLKYINNDPEIKKKVENLAMEISIKYMKEHKMDV